jgi:hypothetical protein
LQTAVRRLITAIMLAMIFTVTVPSVPGYALPFTTVYIKRPGTQYHRRNCIAMRHGRVAISLSKAQVLGFIPCQRCSPPTW